MDPASRAQIERWFVRRGLPHAIDDYSVTEDVLTRAAPFLTAVFFVEVFASFDDRLEGWGQAAAFVAGAAILVGAIAVVNRIRDRAPFQMPDQVGAAEIAVFVLVPALLPLLFSDDRVIRSVAIVGFNLVVLGVGYVVTSYGLVPMIGFGAVRLWTGISQLGLLMARSLPLLLLFTVFIFLNAEMWQVASDFDPAYYAIVVVFIIMATAGFLAMRAPRAVVDLECFDDWDTVVAWASRTDAPLVAKVPGDGRRAGDVEPLDRRDRANVTLLVVISQMVQIILVGTIIAIFYVGFGLLAVRGATIEQWTTAPLDPLGTIRLFGSEIVVTWQHFAVAGFIGAFSALQFGVSMVTDTTYREEFYEDVTGEIRGVLAVRALYLAGIGDPA